MKASIKAHAPRFSSHRMVMDYAEQFYVPSLKRFHALESQEFQVGKSLAAWRSKIRSGWSRVAVRDVKAHLNGELKVGGEFRVHATVDLGSLKPDDVSVEVYAGSLDAAGQIREGVTSKMVVAETPSDGTHLYAAMLPCRSSGRHGFAVRVLPKHQDLVHPYDSGIIAWA
jgi:starch phosphorylase